MALTSRKLVGWPRSADDSQPARRGQAQSLARGLAASATENAESSSKEVSLSIIGMVCRARAICYTYLLMREWRFVAALFAGARKAH